MKMVDMKRPKPKAEKSGAVEAVPGPQEPYPYGLQLFLENDELAKLPGLAGLNAGDSFQMTVEGTVRRVSVTEQVDGKPAERRSIDLQIERIGVPDKERPRLKFKSMGD